MTREHHHPQADELQARLDGQLSLEEQREVDAHLQECARCRGDCASLELLFGELATLEQTGPVPGPRFSRRVMAEILRRDTEARVRRNRVMVPAAAAVFLALVLALWLAPSPGVPMGAGAGGGPAFHVLVGAMLKVVHSGAVMVAEGLDLAFRLARTTSGLLAALPGTVWAACLALFCAVHGALALLLQQYARRNHGGIRS